ncbi:MAG: amidohydrolase family protein, partial [Clostridiales bacterium]|nr:amidohydrolase family protein [Clostridiales bacterium]
HRSSAVTVSELTRLGTEARIGGMLSGKPGIVVMHMGSSDKRLDTVFKVLECSDIPVTSFVPTHCCRTEALLKESVSFNKRGGFIDFTAETMESEAGVALAVGKALKYGADTSRIIISSDAGGSQPEFDDAGRCIGLFAAKSDVLLGELRRLIENEGISKEAAISFFTKNPASLLQKEGIKGELKEGADADILVLGKDYDVSALWAKGEQLVAEGRPLVKGRFEL